jgi:hypothetical protein
MEYQRSVAWGDDEHLPDWSDLGRQALLGFKGFVAVLPYSLATSVLIMPAAMLPPFAVMLGPRGTRFSPEMLAVAFGVFFFMLMASSLVILPLVDSAILRAALYGTFEAPFQFKEMWRLMREHKRELLRAWGFSAVNMGFAFVAIVPLFAFMAMPLLVVHWARGIEALAFIGLGIVGSLVYDVFVMLLGLFLGLARMHYFGSFGRIAYGLEARQAITGG